MTTFTQSPCSGVGWATLSNGMIEIEGQGTPMVHPGDARFTNLERTWRNFGPELENAASTFGLPVSWLLAFATQETGHLSGNREAQRTAVSPANARGFLQILPGPGGPYPSIPAETYFNPTACALLSAEFIAKKLVPRYGMNLPLLGAAYNAGSVRCADDRNVFGLFAEHDYPRALVLYNNAAVQYLKLSTWSLVEALVWSAAGATFVVGAYLANERYGWVRIPGLPGRRVPAAA